MECPESPSSSPVPPALFSRPASGLGAPARPPEEAAVPLRAVVLDGARRAGPQLLAAAPWAGPAESCTPLLLQGQRKNRKAGAQSGEAAGGRWLPGCTSSHLILRITTPWGDSAQLSKSSLTAHLVLSRAGKGASRVLITGACGCRPPPKGCRNPWASALSCGTSSAVCFEQVPSFPSVPLARRG